MYSFITVIQSVGITLIFLGLMTQLYKLVGMRIQFEPPLSDEIYFHINDSHDRLVKAENISTAATINNQSSSSEKQGFGACLMVKQDNDLLYEWIAYHYTVLPLRYVVIGSDIGNTEKPEVVLNKWTTANVSDLTYTILQPDQFIHRHGNYSHYETALFSKIDATSKNDFKEQNNNAEVKEAHHHTLIYRQRGFITTCTEIMQERSDIIWTLFIDIDEFLVLNRMSSDDKDLIVDGRGDLSIAKQSYEIRSNLPDGHSNATVLDVIQSKEHIGKSDLFATPCYTMPRLLVSSLENKTCSEAEAVQERIQNNFPNRYKYFHTIRYFQHAKKGDFSYSRFGKVMMKVSNLNNNIISQIPKNIHRPYPDVCGKGFVHFANSIFYLVHYVGSWDRYNFRSDHRRNRLEWEKRAFVDDGMICETYIHTWFPRFINRIGSEKLAYFLLGSEEIVT